MDVSHFVPNDLLLSSGSFADDLITADLTGTAGYVASTSGETDDDSTNTLKVTVDGGTEQTVTYPASTDTALEKAAAINDQLVGAHATVTGGHVVITSDSMGLTSSIAIGTGTATMVWDTPVAGTGQSATWAKGTLLARNTSTKKLSAYSDSGSTGLNEPVAVLPYEITFSASGDRRERVLIAGNVNKSNLVKHDDSTAIDTLVFDKLIKNSGIVPVAARDHSAYDNE